MTKLTAVVVEVRHMRRVLASDYRAYQKRMSGGMFHCIKCAMDDKVYDFGGSLTR